MRSVTDLSPLAASSVAGVATIPLIPPDAAAWQVLVAVAMLGLTGSLIRFATTSVYRAMDPLQACGTIAAGPFTALVVCFIGWDRMLVNEGLFLAGAGVMGYLGTTALDRLVRKWGGAS